MLNEGTDIVTIRVKSCMTDNDNGGTALAQNIRWNNLKIPVTAEVQMKRS